MRNTVIGKVNGGVHVVGFLRTKNGSDGSTIYCYGNPEHQAAADASDYLKATSALGVSKPITKESEVRIGKLKASDGALAFDVAVDDERIVQSRVKEFVRMSDDLTQDSAWRSPDENEIVVEDGRVTVSPRSSGRAFLKVVLPKD